MYEQISELVQTVGISVVFVLLMAYFVKYMFDKLTAINEDQRRQHAEESQKLTEAINNNTVVMEKILTKLGGE